MLGTLRLFKYAHWTRERASLPMRQVPFFSIFTLLYLSRAHNTFKINPPIVFTRYTKLKKNKQKVKNHFRDDVRSEKKRYVARGNHQRNLPQIESKGFRIYLQSHTLTLSSRRERERYLAEGERL